MRMSILPKLEVVLIYVVTISLTYSDLPQQVSTTGNTVRTESNGKVGAGEKAFGIIGSSLDAKLDEQGTRGTATNGIYAEVVVLSSQSTRSPEIAVYLVRSGISNETEKVSDRHAVARRLDGASKAGTNWLEPFLTRTISNDWSYYLPTNDFCGLVQLCSTNGEKMTPRSSALTPPEACPPTYKFTEVRSNYLARLGIYLGPLNFPKPAFQVSSSSLVAHFQLTDLFQLTEPGEYNLTVFPKIYRRSEADHDLCQRVDIPPVTVTIKWNGDRK